MASLRHMQRNEEARALALSSSSEGAAGGASAEVRVETSGGCGGGGRARHLESIVSACGDAASEHAHPLGRQRSVSVGPSDPAASSPPCASDGSEASFEPAAAAGAAQSGEGGEVVCTVPACVEGRWREAPTASSARDVPETPDRGEG